MSSSVRSVRSSAVQQQQQQPCKQQEPCKQRHPAAAVAAPIAATQLLLGAAAWADERAIGEPTYAYPPADDPVITVMFTLAIGLLSVVTLGVVYLAVLSFFDSRQEKADQAGTSTPFGTALSSKGSAAAEGKEGGKEKEKQRAPRVVVDKSKGFK